MTKNIEQKTIKIKNGWAFQTGLSGVGIKWCRYSSVTAQSS